MDDLRSDFQTVGKARRAIVNLLRAKKIDAPDVDARILVCAASGLDASALIAHPGTELSNQQQARLIQMVERRIASEPVWRILGEREFYGRSFKLSPDTLDPRPDSETLIEAALQIVAGRPNMNTPLRIIDIGTGTGVLLITLLLELPNALGLGTDTSHGALRIASENAVRHGLSDRIRFRNTSALNDINETFDLLISNPPYIPSAEIPELAPEVRNHDPLCALDGGHDGLTVYREIAKLLQEVIPGGSCLFEVGSGQEPEVSEIMRTALGPVDGIYHHTWKDLQGHTRCVAFSAQSIHKR